MTMFGLTIEKLFLVALLAAVIIGPRRLPAVAARLAALIGWTTRVAREAARRVEEEIGASALREEWRTLDPRRYDPRRIIREAWDAGDQASAEEPLDSTSQVSPRDAAAEMTHATAASDTPRGAWVVQGSSGHPRRVWVAAEQ